MKFLFKTFLLSLLLTILVVVILFFTGFFFIPELGLHITYPIRILRGTDMYEGETRGVEVMFIWERCILPSVFFWCFFLLLFLRNGRISLMQIETVLVVFQFKYA